MTHFNPQKKIKPYRNPDYDNYIIDQICMNCHAYPVDPHHVRRLRWGAGIGIKPHSYVQLPLCRKCHKPETESLFDCEREIIRYMTKYIMRKFGKLELIDVLMEMIESRRK